MPLQPDQFFECKGIAQGLFGGKAAFTTNKDDPLSLQEGAHLQDLPT